MPHADQIEQEADTLAADSLINRDEWGHWSGRFDRSEQSLNSFATKIGVHPAIVAGQIRKELNCYSLFPKIVRAVDTKKVFLGID